MIDTNYIFIFLQLLLLTIVKHMVDYPNLITKELFEVSKRQELGTLYNTFIVPRELIWYLYFIYSTTVAILE